MKKKNRTKSKKTVFDNTKLLFLSLILLFIVIEALFILRNHTQSNNVPEVAGASIHK
jgi:hypothetical protein